VVSDQRLNAGAKKQAIERSRFSMCSSFRQLDPKTRRLMVSGNLSLALAIMLLNFSQHASQRSALWAAWCDGLCGFLFGISIGINLLAVMAARRCRASRS
jgi:flagellar biosynthesis protein FliR